MRPASVVTTRETVMTYPGRGIGLEASSLVPHAVHALQARREDPGSAQHDSERGRSPRPGCARRAGDGRADRGGGRCRGDAGARGHGWPPAACGAPAGPGGCVARRPRRRRGIVLTPGWACDAAAEHRRREHQERRRRRDGESADDGPSERGVLFSTLTDAQGHGQHAEDHGEGGHEHGPQAGSPASRAHRAGAILVLDPVIVGEADEQNQFEAAMPTAMIDPIRDSTLRSCP